MAKIRGIYGLYSDAKFKIICKGKVIRLIHSKDLDYYFAPINIINSDYFKLIAGQDFITASFNFQLMRPKEIKWIRKIHNTLSDRYDLEIIESNHEIIELESILLCQNLK